MLNNVVEKLNVSKSNSNVSYINFKDSQSKRCDRWNKIYDKWKNIKRSDDPTKTIADEARTYIAALEFLFLKNADEIIFNSDILKEKSHHKARQRKRFLDQVSDIYTIKFHTTYIYEGKKYHFVYSAKRTENSIEILENPELFYLKGPAKSGVEIRQNSHVYTSKMTTTYNSNRENIEEIERVSLRNSLSISNNTILPVGSINARASEEEKPQNQICENKEIDVERSEVVIEPLRALTPSFDEQKQLFKPSISIVVNNTKTLTASQEKEHYESHRKRINQSPAKEEEQSLEQIYSSSPEPLNPMITSSRDQLMTQEIKKEIIRIFDPTLGEELVSNVLFETSIPGKVKMIFAKQILLNHHQRESMRLAIKTVCGENIFIGSNLSPSEPIVHGAGKQNDLISVTEIATPDDQNLTIGHETKADDSSPSEKPELEKRETKPRKNDGDLQSEIKDSSQGSFGTIKSLLAGHRHFCWLKDSFAREEPGKITISHKQTINICYISNQLGTELEKISEKLNIIIVLKNPDGTTDREYIPFAKRYIPTEEDEAFAKSLRKKQ